MTCVLKAVLATVLLLVLSATIGDAAAGAHHAREVDRAALSIDDGSLNSRLVQGSHDRHGERGDRCASALSHCTGTYLSAQAIAEGRPMARRGALRPAEDRLPPGHLHEAQTPPPRS